MIGDDKVTPKMMNDIGRDLFSQMLTAIFFSRDAEAGRRNIANAMSVYDVLIGDNARLSDEREQQRQEIADECERQDELRGQLAQLKDDAALAERAMRAALELLYAELEAGYPVLEFQMRVIGLLKSALRE